jgi:hypothetical protein
MPTQQLFTDGIITQGQQDAINEHEHTKPLSIHWELRTLLYLGVLLLTTGTSILIYKNIDTIGHKAILGLILLCCISCFYYAIKNNQPYTHTETKHVSPWFYYVVLLGCLLLVIIIGYVQYLYNLFGMHYGLATLLPTIIFFIAAYWFDNKSVISLGISGLAAWAGLTVTPLQLLEQNDFSAPAIVFTGIALGMLTSAIAVLSHYYNIKKHFAFSYHNFAINILCIATLGALFALDYKLLSGMLLTMVCVYYIKYAVKEQAFLFLLLAVVYGYVGLTYLLFYVLFKNNTTDSFVYFGLFYSIISCVGIVQFFLKYKRILNIQ